MKNIKLAVVAAFVLSTSTGFAQDASGWTGYYAGATISNVMAKSSTTAAAGSIRADILSTPNLSDSDAQLLRAMDQAYDVAPKGVNFGLRAGYNYDMGSGLVAGIEGAANFGAATGEVVAKVPFTNKATLDRNIELKARVGYASGKTLFYGVAGASSAQYSFTGIPGPFSIGAQAAPSNNDPSPTTGTGTAPSDPITSAPVAPSDPIKMGVEEKASLRGFVVGLGIEHMLTDKVSVSIEYTRTNYASNTFFAGPEGIDVSLKSDVVRVGVNYRF